MRIPQVFWASPEPLVTQSGATVWTKLIPAGTSVSAHQWHVRTTVLWWVTGARWVSGATSAADSTHQAPVILIQMCGAWVAPPVQQILWYFWQTIGRQKHWKAHAASPYTVLWCHPPSACDSPQNCGVYTVHVTAVQRPNSLEYKICTAPEPIDTLVTGLGLVGLVR